MAGWWFACPRKLKGLDFDQVKEDLFKELQRGKGNGNKLKPEVAEIVYRFQFGIKDEKLLLLMNWEENFFFDFRLLRLP